MLITPNIAITLKLSAYMLAQDILVFIALASSKGTDEPVFSHILASHFPSGSSQFAKVPV